METTTSRVREDFLGICLGGKKCKARKKLRQENRKSRKENRIARRKIRTEKLAAKKDSLVLDNQATRSTNNLLAQLTQPQAQPQPQQPQLIAKNQLAAQEASPPPENKPKDNTLLWVSGGLGTLLILGLITFLVLKK